MWKAIQRREKTMGKVCSHYMKALNAKELHRSFIERIYKGKESPKGYNGRKTDHLYGGLVFPFLYLHKVEKNE